MNIYQARADALAKKIGRVILFFAVAEAGLATLAIVFMLRGEHVLACEALLWAIFLTMQGNGWKNSRSIQLEGLLDQAEAWDVFNGGGPLTNKKTWDERLKEATDKIKK